MHLTATAPQPHIDRFFTDFFLEFQKYSKAMTLEVVNSWVSFKMLQPHVAYTVLKNNLGARFLLFHSRRTI